MIKYENKDADRDDGDDDDNDSNVWEFLVIEKLLSINGQLELCSAWHFPDFLQNLFLISCNLQLRSTDF